MKPTRATKQPYVHAKCPQCGAMRKRLRGAWVRYQRKTLGLVQKELAKAAGTTEAHICDIELGRRDVPKRLEARLLRALRRARG